MKPSTHTRGFTLIEMLVAVALFSVVMVIALGSLLSMSASDRKAESLKAVVNNLNFAVDSMSRAIRTGDNYHCGTSAGQDCTAGANYFAFTASDGSFVEYKLESLNNDPSAAAACGQTAPNIGCIERQITPHGGSASGFTPITAPEVVVPDLSSQSAYLFYVVGSLPGPGDTTQPKVVITISASVQVSATQSTTLYLQTAVTQRLYDQ